MKDQMMLLIAGNQIVLKAPLSEMVAMCKPLSALVPATAENIERFKTVIGAKQ